MIVGTCLVLVCGAPLARVAPRSSPLGATAYRSQSSTCFVGPLTPALAFPLPFFTLAMHGPLHAADSVAGGLALTASSRPAEMPLGHRAYANNRMVLEHGGEQLLPLVQWSVQHSAYLRRPVGLRHAVKQARLASHPLTGVCWGEERQG